MKKTLALIFGGRSSEHEVSVKSAKNIYNAVDKDAYSIILLAVSKEGTWYRTSVETLMNGASFSDAALASTDVVTLISYRQEPTLIHVWSGEKQSIDVVFPIIHGTNGEDGTLQGLLKLVHVPFVGCDVLSSALCMDKEFMKMVATSAGIPNAKYLVLRKKENVSFDDIVKKLGLPFFIKPANAGSSVGVHKVKSQNDFPRQLADSFMYDHKVLAEEFISGKEIECSVMGLNDAPRASLPGELVVKHEFYSYEAKYLDENGADILIPARVSEDLSGQIRKLAVRVYRVLGCDGLARVDFFVTPEDKLIVNEINTLPGFTQISMYPKMWEASGLHYSDLIDGLIQTAFAKFALDSAKKQNYF